MSCAELRVDDAQLKSDPGDDGDSSVTVVVAMPQRPVRQGLR